MTQYKCAARYYDGERARATDVSVTITPDRIVFNVNGQKNIWPIAHLRQFMDQANENGLIIECYDTPYARLHIQDLSAVNFLKSLPNQLKKQDISKPMRRRLLFWGGGAIASVVLILFVIIPLMANSLANMLPIDREEELGRLTLRQVERILGYFGEVDQTTPYCENPAGLAALDQMLDRLSTGFETDYTLRVQVFNSDQVNAFAMPGGYIILLDGLLQAADTPEEVAGVLAHEIGHVVHRDPTRLSLRTAGSAGILSLLFGDFAGGIVLATLGEAIVSANYSQTAEQQADRFSHDVFAAVGLPAARFADFFARLSDKNGHDHHADALISLISTHPDTSERLDAARAADAIGDGPFAPILTANQWQALKSICGTDH